MYFLQHWTWSIMVACSMCGIACLGNVRNLLNHIACSHSNESNFHIACSFPKLHGNCCSIFRSLSNYKNHVYKFHGALLFDDTRSVGEYSMHILCPVCGEYQQSLRQITTHYHSHCDVGVQVPCLVKHCNQMFNLVTSYKAHMSKSHKKISLIFIRDSWKSRLMLIIGT